MIQDSVLDELWERAAKASKLPQPHKPLRVSPSKIALMVFWLRRLKSEVAEYRGVHERAERQGRMIEALAIWCDQLDDYHQGDGPQYWIQEAEREAEYMKNARS